MTVLRAIARPLLASTFIVGAVSALRQSEVHAQRAQPVTDRLTPLLEKAAPGLPVPQDPQNLVRLNAAVQLVAASALATGRAPRLSSTVLAASLVPTTLGGHRFWEESDRAARKNQQLHFAKNASVLGGLLVAAVDTEGKPGLAWRAKRAAKDARRETRRAASDVRREARLAAAKVG